MMWLHELSQRLRGRSAMKHRDQVARRRGLRLSVEQLEDRMVPSNFTAGTVADLIADINAANQQGGTNTITLVAKTTSPYVLTAADNTTDGGNGLPVIAASDILTIVGNGDTIERSTATGTPAFRVFDVATGASLTLQNLTLQNGLIWGGGAIYNQGTVDLSKVIVQYNQAEGTGGGIWSIGSMRLENSTVIQHNSALGLSYWPYASPAYGGGLYVAGGTADLIGVRLSANVAQGGAGLGTSAAGGNGYGGGLYVAGGTVSLTNDVVSGNIAQGGQGGPGFNGINGHRTIYGGWILPPTKGGTGGNGGNGFGGALYVVGGTVTLSDDSMSGNRAQGGLGGRGGNGGNAYYYEGQYWGNGANGGNGGNGGNGFGGALYVGGGTVTLTGDAVSSNGAQGGIGGWGGAGGYGINRGLPGSRGSTGLGEGGSFYLNVLASSVCVDTFTVAHVTNNTASTGALDIFGFYTVCP